MQGLTQSPFLEGLNPPQREAVLHHESSQLVLAGAGSGKTRVLTRKIAFLIRELGVSPGRILAVTFTNKAAGEMRQRVEKLLGDRARGLRVCTFHSYGLQFLRRHEGVLQERGYGRPLLVYDRSDQKGLVKRILLEKNLDEKRFEPGWLLETFSTAKNERDPFSGSVNLEGVLGQLFLLYEQRMKEQGALDFDDLLSLPLELLSRDEDLRRREAGGLDWVLVDEYQDVNRAQYLLLRRLTSEGQKILVVGDPDQAIYGWRGADVSMILHFERDFPGARVTVLEQNYRSTGHILEGANGVIARNAGRPPKKLWTAAHRGEKIRVLRARSDQEDASVLAERVEELLREGYRYGDMALLYRANALSRVYEQKLLETGIPYRVVRGVAFYERREVKDVLGMLRLALQPRDRISLERVGNLPPRGLGKKGLEVLGDWLQRAEGPAASVWEALGTQEVPGIRGKAREGLRGLGEGMRGVLDRADRAREAIVYLWEEYGYGAHLEAEDPERFEERRENVFELLSVLPEDGGVEQVLAEVALFTDAEVAQEDPDQVSLLTLHAAKGLEFPVVFLVGMEEGVFPNARCLGDREALEEERRLCYVGMTRARERLFVSGAETRLLFGNFQRNGFSRFLQEIPGNCVDLEDRTRWGGLRDVRGSGQRRHWSW